MAHAAPVHQQQQDVVQDVNPFMQVLSPKARLSCSACSLLGKLLYPPGPLHLPLNPKRLHPHPSFYASTNHIHHYGANPVSTPPPHLNPNHHYPNHLLNPPTNPLHDPAFTLDFHTSQPNVTCHFDRLHKDLALHFQLQRADDSNSNQQHNYSLHDPSCNESINLSLQQSITDNTNLINVLQLPSIMSDDRMSLHLQPSRKNSLSLQQSLNDVSLQQSINDNVNLNSQSSRKNSLSLQQSINDVSLQQSINDNVNLNSQSSRKNSVDLRRSINDSIDLNSRLSSDPQQPHNHDGINNNVQPSRKQSLNYKEPKQQGNNIFRSSLSLQPSANQSFEQEAPNYHYPDTGGANLSMQPSCIKESYDQPSHIKHQYLAHHKKPTLKVELFRTSDKGFAIRILQSVESSSAGSNYNRSDATIRQINNSLLQGSNAIEKDGSMASSEFNHPTTCSSPNLDHIRTSNGKLSPARITDDSGPMSGGQRSVEADDKLRCTCDTPCGDPNCGCPAPTAN